MFKELNMNNEGEAVFECLVRFQTFVVICNEAHLLDAYSIHLGKCICLFQTLAEGGIQLKQ